VTATPISVLSVAKNAFVNDPHLRAVSNCEPRPSRCLPCTQKNSNVRLRALRFPRDPFRPYRWVDVTAQ
jgi:hypothetical protein